MLRTMNSPLLGSDADGSSFVTSDNGLVIGAVLLAILLIVAILGRSRKNEAKTL